MSDSESIDIKKHVKTYYVIGGALFVLTVVTVAASWIAFGVLMALLVGLLIAIVKGTLVALFFMHLNHERSLIYGVLALTVVFFFVLLLLPIFHYMNSYEVGPLYVP